MADDVGNVSYVQCHLWSTCGNSIPQTAFLGSTNNQDVAFKTNSQEVLRLKKYGKISISEFANQTYGLLYTDNFGDIYKTDYNGSSNTYLNGTGNWSVPAGSNLWAPSGNNIYSVNSGSVGIGTQTPQAKLQIDHDDVTGGILLNRVSTATGHSEIKFNQNGTAPTDQKWAIGNQLVENGPDNFFIWNHSRFLDQKNGTAFYIDENNNIGIDKGLPNEKLDVNGNIIAGTSAESKISCFATADVKSTIWAANNAYGYGLAVEAGGVGYLYANYNTPVPLLTFAYDGFIGVGKDFNLSSITTSRDPNYVLYVQGSIAAREIKVTAGNFPDYVFSDDYNLMSISNLSNFINMNHHLPGIPSAKEVAENNGFELGKMQVMVLEKIEEQALYIIELQKQIDELRIKIIQAK